MTTLRAVSDAVHAVGGLMVLDCIALPGAMWWIYGRTGVDVLVSAPKGLERVAVLCHGGDAQCGVPARRFESTTSTSFACDLKKWLQIMETF